MHAKKTPRSSLRTHAILLGALCAVAGCASATEASDDVTEEPSATTSEALTSTERLGERLFHHAEFDGNGRKCATCHTEKDHGTLSPEHIRALARHDPHNPIFQSIDSDDGVGHSYSRLKENATIRVTIPLPSNVRLLDDPSATSVTINRGIPTINDTPALNPAALMSDGREPDLVSQALSAVNSHFQPGVQPTLGELTAIAAYEKTQFSNRKLKKFADGRRPLDLPEAHTAAQARGKTFFTNADGFCGQCHANNLGDRGHPPQDNEEFIFLMSGELEGDTHVNELRTYVVGNLDGSACDPQLCSYLALPAGGGQCVTAPINGCTQVFRDPGRLLVTGDIFDGSVFKTPILWGVNDTAPYFHDNSAKDLHEVMAHYHRFIDFAGALPGINTNISPQDDEDIIAFLKLF